IIEELLQIQWWHFDIEKITENIGAIVQGDIEPLRKLKR
ncbi:acetyltransferase, partial [Bacillus cereus group sp. Bce025]